MPKPANYQTLYKWQVRYELYMQNVYAKRTYRKYAHEIQLFLEWLPSYIRYPWDVGRFHAKKYREHLMVTRGVSKTFAEWVTRGLSSFWNWMIEVEPDVVVNPWLQLKVGRRVRDESAHTQ